MGLRNRVSAAFALALVIAAAAGLRAAEAADAIPLRFAVITSGGQSEVPYAIQQAGLDKKYGFEVQVVDFTAPGQQYTMLRSDAADLTPGNFVDLLRQRKGGVAIQAIAGFQGYSNRFVVKPDSPIKSFAELRGKKVGNFGPTFLDWLIVRAAGKKAFNLDLQTDATMVGGAPPLLNQFLAKGEIDATLQFSSLTLGPVAHDQQRIVTDLPELMKAAGFGSDPFYVLWIVSEKWTKAYPDAPKKLVAMLNEAYAKLNSDDSLWEPLAKRINVTDPLVVTAYRDIERRIDNPPYRPDLIKPTQALIDAIVAIAGEQSVGITTVDPAAFLFPGQ